MLRKNRKIFIIIGGGLIYDRFSLREIEYTVLKKEKIYVIMLSIKDWSEKYASVTNVFF